MSADQFVKKTPGWLQSSFGREVPNSIIWVENQTFLGAGETIMGNQKYEIWMWDQSAVGVHHYHGDNEVLASDMFFKEFNKRSQSHSFSGSGAQHLNTQEERAIQSIVCMARPFMINKLLHWTDCGVDDISM